MGAWDTLKEIGVSAWDIGEFAAGEVPAVGSIVHGSEALYDLGAGAIDAIAGDDKARHEHISAAALNGIEAIPLVGTVVGGYQIGNDIKKSVQDGKENATEEEMHDWLYPEGSPARELEDEPRYEPVPE